MLRFAKFFQPQSVRGEAKTDNGALAEKIAGARSDGVLRVSDELNASSQDDTDSYSDDPDSLPDDLDEVPLPSPNHRNHHSIYQTHAFQQKFQKEHPLPGVKMEAFTSFMQRAASLSNRLSVPNVDSNNQVNTKGRRFRRSQPSPANVSWWNFERDYDEEKEEADDASLPAEVAAGATGNAGDPAADDEDGETEAPIVYDDFLYGLGDEGTTSHLFAQQSIIRDFVRGRSKRFQRKARDHGAVKDEKEEEVIDFVADSKIEPEIITFHPRLESESSFDSSLDAISLSHDNHFTCFVLDAPARPPSPGKVDKESTCYNKVQLVTPEYFEAIGSVATLSVSHGPCRESPPRITATPSSSSLSSMVHPMNPDHFQVPLVDVEIQGRGLIQPTKSSDDSVSSMGSSTSTPTTRRSESIFQSQKHSYRQPQQPVAAKPSSTELIKSKSRAFEAIRKKLASSFRSKVSGSEDKRVRYSLAMDSPSMTDEDRKKCAALLPTEPMLTKRQQTKSSSSEPATATTALARAASLPHSILRRDQQPLSILLVNPILKVFEIVLVDVLKDTTVGDTLSKARANATDESLSEQKYISLCNRKQELAAPMLPVSLLIVYKDDKRKLQGSDDAASSCSERSQEEQDRANRRDMEARLLVAVPEGSSALICQAIRRMLWKNPKVQRWWKQADPFRRFQGESAASSLASAPSKADKEFPVSKVSTRRKQTKRAAKQAKFRPSS